MVEVNSNVVLNQFFAAKQQDEILLKAKDSFTENLREKLQLQVPSETPFWIILPKTSK